MTTMPFWQICMRAFHDSLVQDVCITRVVGQVKRERFDMQMRQFAGQLDTIEMIARDSLHSRAFQKHKNNIDSLWENYRLSAQLLFELVEASPHPEVFEAKYGTTSVDSLIRNVYEFQFHVNFWTFHHAVFKPKNEMLLLRETIEQELRSELAEVNTIVAATLIGVLALAALSLTRLYDHITKSIAKLVTQLRVMTQGRLVQIDQVPRDEIGQIMVASNKLVTSLARAREFAVQIGQGNFFHHFQPATEHDDLGISLVQMRNALTRQHEEIANQYQELAALNDKLEEQRDKLAEQNKLIEARNNELKEAKGNLEDTVLERTAELTRQNIQLEQFAYMTAHNLRSPIARLLGLTSIFNTKTPDDPFNLTVIQQIRKSAIDFDEVLKDLALILEVQKGVQQQYSQVNMIKSYEKAKALLQAEYEQAKPSVNLRIDHNFLHGIEPYITSIFYNLLSNSLKFRKEQHLLEINITTQKQNDNILLNYTDNGMGIDMEVAAEKLFQPFKRFNTTVSGKGLGLYLIKLQTEAMNGNVTLFSEPGNGVEFNFQFKG